MSDPILLRDDLGPITTLTLNAPHSLNALSTPMLLALSAELQQIATSTQRVVILAAAGKNFCAGHDLKEIQGYRTAPDQGRAAFAALFALCSQVMQQITALPQPVIAEVQGIATAATINPTDISVAMMFDVRFSFSINTTRPNTCAGPKQLAASVAIAKLAPRS